VNKQKQISAEEARRIGDSLYIDWKHVDLEQFRQGLMGKTEDQDIDPETGLTYDKVLLSGQVVLAHAQEIPDYFDRLAKLRAEVNNYQSRNADQE